MATVSEGEDIKKLVWSKNEYSLADFVEKFQLPQIVRVEAGYFSGNDKTSLASGQVVKLHCLRKLKKIVCETVHNKTVVVLYNCPVKCVVQDSKWSKLSAYQLSILSNEVKYILALSGYHNVKSPSNSFKEGTFFEITGIDVTRKCIRCTDTTTSKHIEIPFDCTAMFCSVVDCNEYTLAEVEQKFELPVDVRFLQKTITSEDKIDNSYFFSLVSNEREVKLVKTIENTVVVLTVLGAKSKESVCLEITKDLPVQVAVAYGFLENDATYIRMIKTLDVLSVKTPNFYHDYMNVVSVETRDQSVTAFENTNKNKIPEFTCGKFEGQQGRLSNRARILNSSTVEGGTSGAESIKPVSKLALLLDLESAQPKRSIQKQQEISETKLVYVDVIDPKSAKKGLRKTHTSDSVLNYNADNGDIKENNCDKTGNKKPGVHKTNPPCISKESLLSEIEKRKRKRIGMKTDQTNKPHSRSLSTTDIMHAPPGYIMPDFLPKEPTLLARNKPIRDLTNPSKPLATQTNALTSQSLPKTNDIGDLTSVQVSDNQEHTLTDEVYYDLAAIPTFVDNEIVSSLSPVKSSPLPQKLSGLSVKGVAKILSILDLECYVRVFEEELIDGDMLESLDEEVLMSIGMKPFHCKRMMRFIKGWRPKIY